MSDNFLLKTDCYKMGHLTMYPDDVAYIYSVLEPRGLSQWCPLSQLTDNNYKQNVKFFGLSYYLKNLPSKVTQENVDEFLCYYADFIGEPTAEVVNKMQHLVELGYLPLKIMAVPEHGSYPHGTPLVTVENTHPEHAWLVGFLEGYLLKLWYTTSVATLSSVYCDLSNKFARKTIDEDRVDFYNSISIHDFGYRGCSSDESAALGGAAHLINKPASDTVLGQWLLKTYYPEFSKHTKKLSVPATEHSIMCAYGIENELVAFKTLLEKYKTGVISIVSDTYNIYEVCSKIMAELKELVLLRDGVTVIRPDSGNHIDVLLGSYNEEGILHRLEEVFGSYTNKKGYKVLNDKVRIIWGDGFTLERYIKTMEALERCGWSCENIIVGIGGLLLNLHQRDDHGFAFKATQVILKDGTEKAIEKNPVTDTKKKSKTGRVSVVLSEDGSIGWLDKQTLLKESAGNNLLQCVYLDGCCLV